MSPPTSARFEWGFRSAAAAVAVLALWVELCATLVVRTQQAEGPQRWLWALGFFFAVLPVLAVAVYRWPLVFDFFRSVKVGVVNLTFIGIGAILGVLWHQEDPNFPVPRAGMRQLAHWQELGPLWPEEAQNAYGHYVGGPRASGFRNAHAYFLYKLLHGRGFHLLPGVQRECKVDEDAIAEQVANLETRLPELAARFGEEFAVGLRASSERGLYTRGENAEIGRFELDWDDFFWTLFVWSDRLDLIRVYKSHWFATLWGVLFFGVFSNLFRGGWRRLLRPAKWGFAITHVGVMLVILGGLHGRLLEQRGIVELNVGESAAEFQLYNRRFQAFTERGPLGSHGAPFALRLDAFHADYFDVLDVGYGRMEEDGSARFEFPLEQPKVRVYGGQTLAYDYGPPPGGGSGTTPWLRLEVVEYFRKAEIQARLRPAPSGSQALPLARVSVHGGAGAPVERILTPLFELPLVYPAAGIRVRFELADSPERARALLAQPLPQRLGQLLVVAPDAAADAVFDASIGAAHEVSVGGERYRIEVLRAVPQLQLEPGPDGSLHPAGGGQTLELQAPDNPAALVRITNASGDSEERWVLEHEFHGREPRFPAVELQFLWDRWSAPALARWMVFQLPDDALWCGRVGAPDSLEPIAANRPRDLGSAELTVHEAYRRGELERVPAALEDADFFHPAPPALRLRLTTPEWEKELVLSGAEQQGREAEGWEPAGSYTGPDGKERLLFLRLREDLDDLPVEWRSKLTVLRPAEAHDFSEVATGEIRVNDYLTHGGYRFFQTNADASDPTYSGVGVVYDPGIEMVLAGLYLSTAGTIVVFLIWPLLSRKRKET
ncbi:MAG: hypothetical protein EYC70_03950 [Planctomycetota bacterium]|nr:MAG: hypothetical protein EYC70_03950 [Planctomycetota bacterium]